MVEIHPIPQHGHPREGGDLGVWKDSEVHSNIRSQPLHAQCLMYALQALARIRFPSSRE
jgi:hypothetical protein